MITRNGGKNFFAAHYDWLAAAVGFLAVAAGGFLYFQSLGENADEAAADEVRSCMRGTASAAGVKPVEMSDLDATAHALRTPPQATEISVKTESFLASERRVFCVSNECGHVIVGDLKTCPVCPFCGAKQESQVKVVLDADEDGIPDEWEKKYGLNIKDASDAQADKDKDGFTNKEEFEAKTDPTDPKDHPDYLDDLQLQLPLKETKLPFALRKASQIPDGWRCDFVDPARKDDYGRPGRVISVKVGEKIIDVMPKEKLDYGYTLKSFEKKSVKRERKGMQGMMVDVDVSEAVVERASDGKKLTLVVQPGKKVTLAAVDTQAVLSFNRGAPQTFEVTTGSKIKLYNVEYRVTEVKAVEKGAQVTLETVVGGKKRTLQALEQ